MDAIERATALAPWQDAYAVMRYGLAEESFEGARRSGSEESAARILVQALLASDDAIGANPYAYGPWIRRATLLNNASRPVDAESAARRALELAPTRADAHFQLAIALDAQGKSDEAQRVAREALALMPSYLRASLFVGFMLEREGQAQEARAVYERARNSLRGDEPAELVTALEQASARLGGQ